MGRAPCCSKVGLHRGPWTTREDALLTSYIQNHGEGNWRSLPKLAGLLRCGKSCRLRWMNYLRPDIKRGNITPEEEDLIIRLHRLLGNRWSLIAGRLPGRTDNEIKNYWNSHLSKKLRKQGFVLREAAPRARHLRSPPKLAVENGGRTEGIIYTPKPTRVMSAPLLQANAWSDETEVSANSDWSDAGEFDASNDGFFDAANHDQFLPLQQDEVMLERLFDEYTWLLHSDQMHDCNLFAFEQSLMV